MEFEPEVFLFQTVEEALTKNFRLYLADARFDWVPIAFARDFDEACQMLDVFMRTNRHYAADGVPEAGKRSARSKK